MIILFILDHAMLRKIVFILIVLGIFVLIAICIGIAALVLSISKSEGNCQVEKSEDNSKVSFCHFFFVTQIHQTGGMI